MTVPGAEAMVPADVESPLRSIARDAMTDLVEASQLLDVDVQQLTRRVALITLDVFLGAQVGQLGHASTSQHATDGFGRETQVVGDVRARHHQVQARRRITAFGETIGQVHQEGRETLIGAVIATQQGGIDNVLAHQLEQGLLNAGQTRRQHAQRRKGETAQGHGIERDGVAGIARGVQAIEADQLAGQEEPEDLFATLFVDAPCLDHAGTHRVNRRERLAVAKHFVAGMHRRGVFDQAMQVLQRALVVAIGQTDPAERTRRAEALDVAIALILRSRPAQDTALRAHGLHHARELVRDDLRLVQVAIEAHRDDAHEQSPARGDFDAVGFEIDESIGGQRSETCQF